MSNLMEDLSAAIEAAFKEGFYSPATYNDTVLNNAQDEWERSEAKDSVITLLASLKSAEAERDALAAELAEMNRRITIAATCNHVARMERAEAKLAELEGLIKDAEDAGMTVNIKAEFSYCKVTGFVFHEKKHGKTAKGKRAGSEYKDGYRYVKVNGLVILEHRLAWYLHYGKWPKNQIDHKNMNRADNRISNLREADFFENNRNKPRQSNNTSGYKGVSFNKRTNKYVARITAGKTRLCLGYFNTAEEAASAYKNAAKEHHHEFART